MSNKAWPLKNYFLRIVSKFFKCYVLVKNFDRKPAISLKTTFKFWRAAGAPIDLFYFLFIYLDYPVTPVLSCAFAIKYMFSSEILAVTKTTSKYIAGLQVSIKYKYMNGKSNYKLKS